MHPLQKKITALLLRQKLIFPDSFIILAVSAGPDSMAMLHLLAAFRQTLSFTPIAVYIHHGLRPKEAKEEERLVRDQAELLGLSSLIRSAPVKEYAARHHLSLEHAGRELRYAILREIAGQRGAARIAVAHTADDQAEEILLRLIRGTGTKGLSGMTVLRPEGIIRPLLTTTKKEIFDYLNDKKIPFCEDSSNRDLRFLRNRIRHHLLPLLAGDYNPNIGETLRHTAAILGEEENFLAEKTSEISPSILKKEGADLRLDAELFIKLHVALQRRLLENAFWLTGTPPRFSTIEQARSLINKGQEGAQLHLGDGLRLIKKDGFLEFVFPKGKKQWRGSIPETDVPNWNFIIPSFGTFFIEALNASVEVTEQEKTENACLQETDTDLLDLDKISFPLTIRSARPGDRFHPLGAPGSKKVADFLGDKKISRHLRRCVPVLESDGRIAALLGLRIDHHFRITAATRRILAIRVVPEH
jgi:tRNA(Ile)-lysidine synthase